MPVLPLGPLYVPESDTDGSEGDVEVCAALTLKKYVNAHAGGFPTRYVPCACGPRTLWPHSTTPCCVFLLPSKPGVPCDLVASKLPSVANILSWTYFSFLKINLLYNLQTIICTHLKVPFYEFWQLSTLCNPYPKEHWNHLQNSFSPLNSHSQSPIPRFITDLTKFKM